MTTTTRSSVPAITSPATWRATLARTADTYRVWTGHSGLTLTGPEIAQHADTARAWLTANGWSPTGRGRIYDALYATSPGGPEDVDTRHAISSLLGLLLQVRLGCPTVPDYEAWEARAGRTWREVDELLATASTFAREHGPAGGER